jgi:serpin B
LYSPPFATNNDEDLAMATATLSSSLATRLYNQLTGQGTDQNLFFSPFSIQVALAMCAVGAKGETRDALIDLIGAPGDLNEQNQQYADLLLSICSDGSQPTTLVTANAVWAQKDYTFKPEFAEAIERYYDGVFRDVDFQSPIAVVEAINDWVQAKTNGRINDLLSADMIDAHTRLVLTNAIYFKAEWEKLFEMDRTKDEPWYGPDGQTAVHMMHKKEGLNYFESDVLQAVNLPYKGRHLSMLVVLPRRKDGLPMLEQQWTQALFDQITTGFDSETVNVWLPRFKFDSSFALSNTLCAMGAEIAFSDRADFTGIAGEPLMISEVIHKAFVDVTEEGTEAAAATAVIMTRSAGVGPRLAEPLVFRADHPFLFFIWNRKTHAIFFSGRVVNP